MTCRQRSATPTIHVDAEGFLTDYGEWDEDLAESWPPRSASSSPTSTGRPSGSCARTTRRKARPPPCAGSSTLGRHPDQGLFALFPGKPAKKMAYVAGLPKPHGCV